MVRSDTILASNTLEDMAASFGFVYTDSFRRVHDEGERISGDTAREYFEYAAQEAGRYQSFIDGLVANSSLAERHAKLRILDVGCGVGILTSEVAACSPNSVVYGFDISEDMIAIAEAFMQKLSSCIRKRTFFSTGSVYDIGQIMGKWNVGDFDIVFSRRVLHRLANKELALGNMLEAAREGGMVYLQAFCGDLDNDEVRQELVENVKKRAREPRFMNFAKTYLSAVLRAPKRNEYESLFRNLVAEYKPTNASLRFFSYDCEMMIVR